MPGVRHPYLYVVFSLWRDVCVGVDWLKYQLGVLAGPVTEVRLIRVGPMDALLLQVGHAGVRSACARQGHRPGLHFLVPCRDHVLEPVLYEPCLRLPALLPVCYLPYNLPAAGWLGGVGRLRLSRSLVPLPLCAVAVLTVPFTHRDVL